MAGFEPTNARVKVWCLTAWRHPNICTIDLDTRGIVAYSDSEINTYFCFAAIFVRGHQKGLLHFATGPMKYAYQRVKYG